jgi:hypothetical protein
VHIFFSVATPTWTLNLTVGNQAEYIYRVEIPAMIATTAKGVILAHLEKPISSDIYFVLEYCGR